VGPGLGPDHRHPRPGALLLLVPVVPLPAAAQGAAAAAPVHVDMCLDPTLIQSLRPQRGEERPPRHFEGRLGGREIVHPEFPSVSLWNELSFAFSKTRLPVNFPLWQIVLVKYFRFFCVVKRAGIKCISDSQNSVCQKKYPCDAVAESKSPQRCRQNNFRGIGSLGA